jgi:hypothetical protein
MKSFNILARPDVGALPAFPFDRADVVASAYNALELVIGEWPFVGDATGGLRSLEAGPTGPTDLWAVGSSATHFRLAQNRKKLRSVPACFLCCAGRASGRCRTGRRLRRELV